MPLPTKKHTKGRTGKRRAHNAIDGAVLTSCPKCKSDMRPHYACENCGHYRGRGVIAIQTELEKKKKKKEKKEKESKEQEAQGAPTPTP